MAYLIEGKNCPLIYCANYRVGSTAMHAVLMDMGAEKLGQHHDPPNDIPPNAVVAETVRHHCDVMVSWWCWRGGDTKFSRFVNLVLDGRHGALSPTAFYDKFPSNHVIKYETFKQEWSEICDIAGLEYREIKRTPTKRPTHVNWEILFTPTLLDKVQTRYKDEMEKFGWL